MGGGGWHPPPPTPQDMPPPAPDQAILFPNFSFGSAWGASAMAPKTRKKKKKDPDVRMMFILPVWGKRVTWGERG